MADASNFNPQAKNAQAILRFWTTTSVRPSIFHYAPPQGDVGANPNVDLISLNAGRLWQYLLYSNYFRGWDAVFCPGLHDYVDWLALKTLGFLHARPMIINTFEGLACSVDSDEREEAYSSAAGHRVYCQRVAADVMRRADDLDEMSDHIIAITPFMGRLARSRLGDKVSVLPLGVDTTLFVPGETCAEQRARPRIVAAGRVAEHKRPEAFLALARRFPQADFVWFGEGEMRDLMSEEVRRLGLSNAVFPGAKQPAELAREFMQADVFVHTAFAEGFGKVTLEAAAAGLPAIVFGFYEMPIVEDGRNGFVVWSDDEMAERLEQLLASPERAVRMGAAGRALAERWDWSELAPQWERRIVDLVRRHTEPPR